MNRRTMLWAALVGLPFGVAGGLAYAKSQKAGGYNCPVTGENLPCEKCCPLNKAAEQKPTAARPYTCPVTGENLPCEKCCPLNKATNK